MTAQTFTLALMTFAGVTFGGASLAVGATAYTVGDGPVSITSGDLNGDGAPDLLTANLIEGSVSIVFNNGDGTFEPFTALAVGPTRDATIAEMTGDGINDIVVGTENLGGAILVWPGLGDGQFSSALETPLGMQGISSLRVRDIDGDSRDDVEAYFQEQGVVVTLMGNGDGFFQAPRQAPGTLPLPPLAISTALNDDAALDTATVQFDADSVLVSLSKAPKPHDATAMHSSSKGNGAVATFSTFTGCEDNLVGVTVRENVLKDGPGGKEYASEVSVFGNFDDICEFGSHTSFFGTATLNGGEFSQDGVNGATLNKTLTVAGFELQIALTWTGEGEVLVQESKIKDEGPPRLRGQESISFRRADVAGAFIVSGLNQISGNTVDNGTLQLFETKVTSIAK